MQITKHLQVMAVAALALTACSRSSENGSSGASSDIPTTSTGQGSASQPDNTGRNVRDRSETSVTPGDQGGSDADREITRRIRRAIIANNQLSTEAKNIKVITSGGKVTLRGPVGSDQERDTIARLVQQAGAQSVDNQLEVKAANQ